MEKFALKINPILIKNKPKINQELLKNGYLHNQRLIFFKKSVSDTTVYVVHYRKLEELYKFMRKTNQELYEVIFDGQLMNLYFDFDILDNDKREDLLHEILKIFQDHFSDYKIYYLTNYRQVGDKVKSSFHFHVPKKTFTSNIAIRDYLQQHILPKMKNLLTGSQLDFSVYRTFGLFRIAYACKNNDRNAILVPKINNFKYFLKTLITYHEDDVLKSFTPKFETIKRLKTVRKIKQSNSVKASKNKINVPDYLKKDVSNEEIITEEDEEYREYLKYVNDVDIINEEDYSDKLEQIIMDYLSEDFEQVFTIRSVNILKDGTLLINLNRIKSSYCLLCCTTHDSDNGYLKINVENNTVHYYCFRYDQHYHNYTETYTNRERLADLTEKQVFEISKLYFPHYFANLDKPTCESNEKIDYSDINNMLAKLNLKILSKIKI